MSASREKKNRQDAENATLSQREQKKIQEERQARRSTIVYTVVGIICVVFAAFLLVWNSGILQRTLPAVTVNGVTYTAADVQYYFNSRRSSEIMSYYLSTYSYPFDTSVSLKDQIYNETTGQTWYDYLMEQTMDTISATTALAAMAEAEGHTISEDSQTALDEELAAVETDWIGAGYSSRDAYLRGLYGSFITYDRYKELLTQDVLVSDYVASVQDSFTYTDEDYQAYYEEHKDELDTLVLTSFSFRAQVQTTDEEGNDLELTEEETAAALEEAKTQVKAQAEELMGRLEAGEDPEALAEEYADSLSSHSVSSETLGSRVNSNYSEWALDEGRQEGDVTLAESASGTTNYYYYVVRFENRYLDETPTASVRHILITPETDEGADEPTQEQLDAAQAEAQALLDQWAAGEATEESFAALAEANSDDSGSASDGGLISGISANSSLVTSFRDWAMDPDRQPGDTGLVESDYGWHVMYYVADGDPAWIVDTADPALRSEDYTAWEEEAVQGYEAQSGIGLNLVTG